MDGYRISIEVLHRNVLLLVEAFTAECFRCQCSVSTAWLLGFLKLQELFSSDIVKWLSG